LTINVINKAVVCADADGRSSPVRTRAVFEPPIGKYQWPGESEFVGVLEPAQTDLGRSIKITFYGVQ
jgi:hypothetical protein